MEESSKDRKMNRNYFFWIVVAALFCLFLIFFSLWRDIESPIVKQPLIPSPKAPFKTYIAGTGIVESASENILITSPSNRLIEKVFVQVDDPVKKGDILFQLDNSDLLAKLNEQKIALAMAQARLNKLRSLPRSEDLVAAMATANQSKAELELAKSQYEMTTKLPDPRAISLEERNRRLYNYQQAEARWQQTDADFKKIQAGAWKPDIEIAMLEVDQAKAALDLIQTEIEKTKIKSPINGTVLQVKIHEGEYSSMDPTNNAAMIIGNTDEMFVRASINQLDIPFFRPNAPAVAYLQGDARLKFPLKFVRIEPYLVYKQNFSNLITEKIDTRVLQILYKIEKNSKQVLVGQQMDVFIEADYSSRE